MINLDLIQSILSKKKFYGDCLMVKIESAEIDAIANDGTQTIPGFGNLPFREQLKAWAAQNDFECIEIPGKSNGDQGDLILKVVKAGLDL